MYRHLLIALALAAGSVPAGAQSTRDPGDADPSAAPTRREDPVREQIVAKLTGLRVTLEFAEAPLEEVVEFVRQISNLNILIDNSVLERHGRETIKISMKVKDLPLGSALKLMLETRGLTLVYRDSVLLVVTEDRANQTVVMQIYDVRDLMMKINDFPGPEINLEPYKGAIDTNAIDPMPQLTEDFILTSIKQNCGKATWDANPRVSAEMNNGLLVVTQTQDVHKQIRNLLNKLRANK
jgi:type II secretory pathway component GspD/PulD (secretin)